jgi:hypothetical protein
MATRIKMEVVFTVSDDEVTLDAAKLVRYMSAFKPTTVWNRTSDGPGPFYDSCEVSAEKKRWEGVA